MFPHACSPSLQLLRIFSLPMDVPFSSSPRKSLPLLRQLNMMHSAIISVDASEAKRDWRSGCLAREIREKLLFSPPLLPRSLSSLPRPSSRNNSSQEKAKSNPLKRCCCQQAIAGDETASGRRASEETERFMRNERTRRRSREEWKEVQEAPALHAQNNKM